METVRMAAMELRSLHTPESTGGSLTMFEMRLSPGGRMPVPHRHSDREETVCGSTGANLRTPLHIPRGIVHGFTNNGPEPTGCLCVLTSGVLAPAAMRATMLRHGLVPEAA